MLIPGSVMVRVSHIDATVWAGNDAARSGVLQGRFEGSVGLGVSTDRDMFKFFPKIVDPELYTCNTDLTHGITQTTNMRTKALLALAALAIAIPASAQVYSANVVGYVNYTIQPGTWNMICNPLKATDNSLLALFPIATDGDYVVLWNAAANDINYDVTPTFGGGVWDPAYTLNPGEAVFYASASETPRTVTYVGEVIQGNFTNTIAPGTWNAIGSSAPLGGSLNNAIAGLAATDGDYIVLWNPAANDINYDVTPTFGGGVWDPSTDIAVGEGFFYASASENAREWVRNFVVPTN